ncbi:hypothetical protein AMTRI_Chr06g201470 [Amborella trichopoda]
MKFELFGGMDAPDWVLAEIITIGKLSPEHVEVISSQITQHILDGSFDYTTIVDLTSNILGVADLKACIATLRFFISNLAKFDLNVDLASRELQQMGLPKDYCESICRPYVERKESLQKELLNQVIQIPSATIDAWRVQVGPESSVILMLNSKSKGHWPEAFNGLVQLTPDKFRLLLHGLKQARSLMQGNP